MYKQKYLSKTDASHNCSSPSSLHAFQVCTPQHLRLLVECHLQALKAVDGIWAAYDEKKELLVGGAVSLDASIFASFHDALALANTAAGRSAVAQILIELETVPILLALLDNHALDDVTDVVAADHTHDQV